MTNLSLPNEIWKPVNGFENYLISNLGRLMSLSFNRTKVPKIMQPNIASGYCQVVIWQKPIKRHFKIHRLVATAFIPNPENKCTINHINGIKTDNRVENLEWCTVKENVGHAFKTGLRKVGSNHQRAKISAQDVIEIRSLRGKMFQKDIAVKFGLTQNHISAIQLNQSWKIVV